MRCGAAVARKIHNLEAAGSIPATASRFIIGLFIAWYILPYLLKSNQAAAAKRHYEANKKAIVARSAAYKAKAKQEVQSFLREFLLKNPCVDCGESDIIVLEFDHKAGEDKKFNIGECVRKGFSMKLIAEEVEKCEVRCANCHRRKTYKDRCFTHKDIDFSLKV